MSPALPLSQATARIAGKWIIGVKIKKSSPSLSPQSPSQLPSGEEPLPSLPVESSFASIPSQAGSYDPPLGEEGGLSRSQEN